MNASKRRLYYVSCIDGPRRSLVAGPYSSHAAALADVDRVRGAAYRVDFKSHWYAWGTAGVSAEVYSYPGVLGRPEDIR